MRYENVNKIICEMINDISQFTVKDGICEISADELEEQKISQKEANTIFRKLVEEKRIEMKQWTNDEAWSHISILDPYVVSIGSYKFTIVDSAYFSTYTRNEVIEKNNNTSKMEYKIVLKEDRRIMLNGDIELSKPDFNGENEVVFKYLYEHPNKTFKKDELETLIKIKIFKSFGNIVENLGFKKELKKMFFDTSKDSIKFYNPARKI